MSDNAAMTGDFEFEVWQDDVAVASACSADRTGALRDALHYAAIYGQDGPVTLYEVKRTEVSMKDAGEWLAGHAAPPVSTQKD